MNQRGPPAPLRRDAPTLGALRTLASMYQRRFEHSVGAWGCAAASPPSRRVACAQRMRSIIISHTEDEIRRNPPQRDAAVTLPGAAALCGVTGRVATCRGAEHLGSTWFGMGETWACGKSRGM